MIFQVSAFRMLQASRSRIVKQICVSLALAIVGMPAASRAADAPWKLTPYKIVAVTAIDDPAEFPAHAIANLHSQVEQLATSHIGAVWQLQARTASARLQAEMRTGLKQLSAEEIISHAHENDSADKLFLIFLSREENQWVVSLRELDLRTFHSSPLLKAGRVARRQLPQAILRLMIDAFSPTARLETAHKGTITGELQAAALATAKDSPVLVSKGDPLVPIVRRTDRLGRCQPKNSLPIAWTVLEVKNRDVAEITCRIHSALRSPLGGRSRMRLQRFAHATRYKSRPTALKLVSPEKEVPLIGYEIVMRDPETKEAHPLGSTDEQGVVEISATPKPWRLLYVRHGDRFLARLPLVEGLSPRYRITLPNDDVRFAAEGFASAIRQEIVDTVARRQILSSRIRRSIAAEDFEAAEQLLRQFRTMEDNRIFSQRIDAARGELIADNARAQQLIDELFSQTRQTLDRYLDPAEAGALESQLRQAKASN